MIKKFEKYGIKLKQLLYRKTNFLFYYFIIYNLDHKKISDNAILNLEIVHDNDINDLDIYIKNSTAYDLVNRKKINISIKIPNPEQIMKDLLFNNIEYGSVHITDKKFEKEAINFDKDIIFVFDNKQFSKEVIEKCRQIYKQQKLTIFVPFVYLSELLLNCTSSTIKKEKEKIINNYGNICNLIFDEYLDTNNKIKSFYKKEMDDIGLYYDNKNDKLINYNVFSKNTEFNNNIMMEHLGIIYKFINNFTINPIENDINNMLNEVKKEILHIAKEGKINKSDINIKLVETRKFVMALKESRDTYYFKEINEMKKKYNNYNFVYITSDEISNCRCVLEKISSLNVYNTIPRYIIHIDNNKIILKLFNIYHKLTPNNYDIIKINEEINSGVILKHSKALISKIIVGGYNKKNINNKELITNIKNKNYDYLGNYVANMYDKIHDDCNFLYEDKFKTISEIAKNNNIYTDKINKIMDYFNELIYLYNNMDFNQLINNIKFGEEYHGIDIDFKMGLLKINEFYDEYKNLRKKEINKNDWEILYFITIFYHLIDFTNRKEDLEFYKYIFPEIFNYPIEEFTIMYNYLSYDNELNKKKELEEKMNE